MRDTCARFPSAQSALRFAGCAVLISFLMMLVGCDALFATPEPTPTPTPTLAILPPSVTVNPRIPTAGVSSLDDPALGTRVSAFTPAAPPVVGERRVTVTPRPLPTQATIPMQFLMQDGLIAAAIYYGAGVRPAPAALLLHGAGGRKEDWQTLAAWLQAAGFNVLALDLRGHGETGGQPDWSRAPEDVREVFARLRGLPGVDSNRASLVGAGVGANLALVVCAEVPECRAAALLSPALDYQGITTAEALGRYGRRPLLLAASRADHPSGTDSAALDGLAQGESRLLLYDGAAHGTDLLAAQPNLSEIISRWLAAQ